MRLAMIPPVIILGLAPIFASVPTADDWAAIGEGAVTIDGDAEVWWVPRQEALGGGWQLEGSGMFSYLRAEAYPAPIGEPAMPKPHLRIEIMAPALQPRLTEVLWTPAEGVAHISRQGDVNVRETDMGWAILFQTEVVPLDPATYEPVSGAAGLLISGDFELTRP